MTLSNGRAQFSLMSILIFMTLACFLFAVIANKSTIGFLAWSLAGLAHGWFVNERFMRRSLMTLFSGTCLLAIVNLILDSLFQIVGMSLFMIGIAITGAGLSSVFANVIGGGPAPN